MNLALFFEGTGQGVAGKVTNVTRLHNLCREDEGQHLHLESAPGTHVWGSFDGRHSRSGLADCLPGRQAVV